MTVKKSYSRETASRGMKQSLCAGREMAECKHLGALVSSCSWDSVCGPQQGMPYSRTGRTSDLYNVKHAQVDEPPATERIKPRMRLARETMALTWAAKIRANGDA